MANNCYFEMKIAGAPEAVEEFMQMLKWQGPYANSGLGRVFHFDISCASETEKDPATGNIAILGSGDCAWSVKTAMIDRSGNNLQSATERLGVVVELFSSEPGVGFQEYYLINKGEILEHECVDYEEHCLEGASEEYIQEVMEDHNLTREELMAQVNDNGDFCVGGFENFAEFNDLFTYLEPARKPALHDRIAGIKSRDKGETLNGAEHGTDARNDDRGRE